jgi:hypothetical protein
MSTDPDIADRDQQMLAELAELDLALARRVQACAMATEDPDQLANLSRAYQRVARSLRQTLVLKDKLTRNQASDRLRAEIRRRPAFHTPTPVERRFDELAAAVGRVIWAERECETPEEELEEQRLFLRMDKRLEELADADGFEERLLDEQVAELCAELGLNPANVARWRDLEDPDFDAYEEPEEPRLSSA